MSFFFIFYLFFVFAVSMFRWQRQNEGVRPSPNVILCTFKEFMEKTKNKTKQNNNIKFAYFYFNVE